MSASFYGEQTLFAKVSLQLNAGERYGLVGANGSGKTRSSTCCLAILKSARVQSRSRSRLRLGVLQQDQFLYEDESILNVALMGNEALWEATVAKERLLAASTEEFDADKFAQLEETFLSTAMGTPAQARAGAILEGLGLPAHIHDDPLSTLSGGFKLRVLLAQVLASAPDVLLARRADQPPRHPLDPLARNLPVRLCRGRW